MNKVLFAAFAALALLDAVTAQTRTPIPAPEMHGYLYLPGIAGTVTDSGYRSWHKVDGFGLQVSSRVSGRTAIRSSSPLAIGADLGVALPQLVVKCASGQAFSSVILRMHRPSESRYFLELRLYSALVVAVNGAGSTGSGAGGGQTIEFDYTRMTMTEVNTTTGVRTARTFYRAAYTAKSVPVATSESNDYEVLVRVEGIAGSSTRSGYRGWHEMDSYAIGVRRPVSSTRTASTPVFSPLQLKSAIRALPQFTVAAMTGQSFRTVEVHVFDKRITRGPVLVMTLRNVLVSKATGAAGRQEVELGYGSVQFTYYQGGRGSRQRVTSGGWNLATNTAL